MPLQIDRKDRKRKKSKHIDTKSEENSLMIDSKRLKWQNNKMQVKCMRFKEDP